MPAGPAALLALLGAGVLAATLSSARAQAPSVLTPLHTFSGSDGADPNAPLTQGSDGNFYGTTQAGGTNNDGTVFRITPAGEFTTLYSFGGGSDSLRPGGGLLQGGDGNFYGTTLSTAFKITPAGVLTTIYTFVGGANGSSPNSPLVLGSDGNFYGTTSGSSSIPVPAVAGTAYRITPAGTVTTLYNFDDFPADGLSGLGYPTGVVQGSDGNFYGAVFSQGDGAEHGTLFQLTPAGAVTKLAAFGGNGYAIAYGEVGLVQGMDGIFYGATTLFDTQNNNLEGTIFTFTPAGALATLYNFSGADGAAPNPLIQGSDGNFYGTTNGGGASDDGTVFAITPAGALTTLYSFTGGSDSAFPNGALVQGSDGSFYGTTSPTGTSSPGYGSVFKLAVAPATLPVVTVTALESELDVNSGSVGHFQVVRQGGDLSQPLKINYEMSGTAVPGVDYRARRGRKIIQPGKTDAQVFIVPEGDLGGKPRKKVQLTLLPGDGYTVGSPVSATMMLMNE